MKQKLSILRNLSIAAAVALALAFGVTQAWANTSACTLPPSITCLGEPDPNGFCSQKCEDYEYPPFGICNPMEDCCTCPEK